MSKIYVPFALIFLFLFIMYGAVWFQTPTATEPSPAEQIRDLAKRLKERAEPIILVLKLVFVGITGMAKILLGKPL